jgi:heat shock protein HslJ
MRFELHVVQSALSVAWALLYGVLLLSCGGLGAKPGSQPETVDVAKTAATTENPLADTEWRLVAIQSMDDAVGTISPEDPSWYTMHLHADGTVTMNLNCNHAIGSWSVEPSIDPASGRFQFGPLATTKVLCPPPRLDEQVVSQAEYVRSYLLKDGRLYLSLFADGGIYAWEPDNDVRFRNVPDAALEEAILRESPEYTRTTVEAAGGIGKARYIYGRVDLNGDGREEVLAYLLGSIFCGTGGCNLMLFSDAGSGYRLINNFPISRLPLIVSPEKTNSWSDLVRPESGGGAPPSYVRHTFDGKRYVERERLPGDTAPEGKRYLSGKFTFQDGVPLEPNR